MTLEHSSNYQSDLPPSFSPEAASSSLHPEYGADVGQTAALNPTFAELVDHNLDKLSAPELVETTPDATAQPNVSASAEASPPSPLPLTPEVSFHTDFAQPHVLHLHPDVVVSPMSRVAPPSPEAASQPVEPQPLRPAAVQAPGLQPDSPDSVPAFDQTAVPSSANNPEPPSPVTEAGNSMGGNGDHPSDALHSEESDDGNRDEEKSHGTEEGDSHKAVEPEKPLHVMTAGPKYIGDKLSEGDKVYFERQEAREKAEFIRDLPPEIDKSEERLAQLADMKEATLEHLRSLGIDGSARYPSPDVYHFLGEDSARQYNEGNIPGTIIYGENIQGEIIVEERPTEAATLRLAQHETIHEVSIGGYKVDMVRQGDTGLNKPVKVYAQSGFAYTVGGIEGQFNRSINEYIMDRVTDDVVELWPNYPSLSNIEMKGDEIQYDHVKPVGDYIVQTIAEQFGITESEVMQNLQHACLRGKRLEFDAIIIETFGERGINHIAGWDNDTEPACALAIEYLKFQRDYVKTHPKLSNAT
jgi:hypothetical protein